MRAVCAALAGAFLAAAALGPARADDIPPCPLPKGAVSVPLPGKTPLAIQRALQHDVGDMAAPGEDFDATDEIMFGRNRRLIFIWNIHRRWIVATERGGVGYNDPIFAYDLGLDGQHATLVETRTAIPGNVCATAYSLIPK